MNYKGWWCVCMVQIELTLSTVTRSCFRFDIRGMSSILRIQNACWRFRPGHFLPSPCMSCLYIMRGGIFQEGGISQGDIFVSMYVWERERVDNVEHKVRAEEAEVGHRIKLRCLLTMVKMSTLYWRWQNDMGIHRKGYPPTRLESSEVWGKEAILDKTFTGRFGGINSHPRRSWIRIGR